MVLDIFKVLSGGDRRSIGAANQIVPQIISQPELLAQIFDGLRREDPVLRMRCADVAEKVTAVNPALLQPYKHLLIDEFSRIEQKEVRWHLAAMLVRLRLTKREVVKVRKILQVYLEDSSSIVKTMAMESMVELSLKDSSLRADINQQIEALIQVGTPAMRARGKKLLARLAEQN